MDFIEGMRNEAERHWSGDTVQIAEKFCTVAFCTVAFLHSVHTPRHYLFAGSRMIDYLLRTVNRLRVYVEIICTQGRSQGSTVRGQRGGNIKYILKIYN